jgi:hypothetical protein
VQEGLESAENEKALGFVLVDIDVPQIVCVSYNVDEDSSKYCAGDCATILWVLI